MRLIALLAPSALRGPLLLGALALGAAACETDGGLKVSNTAPEATITSHEDGASVAERSSVVLRGAVSDANHARDELVAVWSVGGAEACPAAAPDASGVTSCTVSLEAGVADISLTVTDPLGGTGVAYLQLQVQPGDAPVVDILRPDPASRIYAGEPIDFAALVSDAEDPAPGLALSWSSDLAGDLALPTSADDAGSVAGTTSLSEGTHTVTLEAVDSSGRAGRDSVTLTVGPANTPPSCAITAPADGDAAEAGTPVRLDGTASDPDELATALDARWISDKDGELGVSAVNSDGTVSFTTSALSVDTHTLSLQVSDELGVVCVDSVVVAISTRPDVSIDLPADGDIVNDGDLLTFIGTTTDLESDPQDLVIEWSSDVDGVINTTPADSGGQATFNTRALSPGAHLITLLATDEAGLSASDRIQITVNGLPSAPVISISPDPASTADDLLATVTSPSVDPDGDPVSYTWAWARNGSPMAAYTAATLPAAATARGEVWTATATPSDGMGAGPAGSDSVTIGNSAPSVASLSLSPTSPTTSATVTASASGADPDGDPVTFTYAWAVNGVSTATSGTTLSGVTWFSRGDTVTVTATPSDGAVSGTPSSASVTVANTAPSLTAALSPSTPSTSSTLTVSSSTSDADGDSVSLSYAWRVNGAGIAPTTASIGGSWFNRGDTVAVTVTASDGTDSTSTILSTSIANTAPTTPTITILPASPAEGEDDLTCRVTSAATDADGDAITYLVSWTVDGTDYPDGDTGAGWAGPSTTTWTDDTVPMADTLEGEVWTCAVRADDGTDLSAAATASTTIQAPTSTCGNLTLDGIEEYDPAPGPFSTVRADSSTCRWDFSAVQQLYCNGSCTWAGGSGCDQADADIFCKLKTGNPSSTAITWTNTTALAAPGFPCMPHGYGSAINVVARGVSVSVRYQDASILGNHGAGAVITNPVCTNP